MSVESLEPKIDQEESGAEAEALTTLSGALPPTTIGGSLPPTTIGGSPPQPLPRLISVSELPFSRDWQKTLSLIAIVVASAGWLVCLVTRGQSAEALAWNITLLALIAVGAINLCGSCQQKALAYSLRFSPDEHKRKSGFTSAFALSYLLTSIALVCWSIVPELHPTTKKLVQRQIIDIELVSHADAQNKHDILPGTLEKESLRKRSGTADKTIQASITPLVPSSRKANPAAEPNTGVRRPQDDVTNADNKEKSSSQKQQTTAASQKDQIKNDRKDIRDQSSPQELTELKPTFIVSKANPSDLAGKGFQNGTTLVINPLRNNTTPKVVAQRNSSQTMDLEEVTPMEMVEMTDNTGDQSEDVWQSGGRSAGGTGAPNEMQKYLKELNRRIKRAWAPPHGQSRRAQILFRINRNGRLVQIKLITSCGDEATDASALQAVVSASPFKALPEEFQERVLDVQYTFNYKVDELTEVRHARWQ